MTETISPTAERFQHAPFGIASPEVGQKIDRRAHAVRDIWQDMRDRKQITEEEAEAGRRYARHRELALRGRSVTPSYGTRFAEGTPVSQLATSAAEEDAARVVDYGLLLHHARQALPPVVVVAVDLACDCKTPTEIGRTFSQAANRLQLAATGVTLVRIGCQMLAAHYGTGRKTPENPGK